MHVPAACMVSQIQGGTHTHTVHKAGTCMRIGRQYACDPFHGIRALGTQYVQHSPTNARMALKSKMHVPPAGCESFGEPVCTVHQHCVIAESPPDP